MRSVRTVLFLISAVALPLAAAAREEIKLEGTIYLDEDHCAKGTANPDCLMNFVITGKAAKALYDSMPETGTLQECTGDVEKFNAGGMHCSKGEDGDNYFCDFGYYFKNGSFGGGGDGC